MNADRDIPVRDNSGESRFESEIEGRVAFVEYERRDGKIWYTHSEVPPELEGRGIGSALAKFVLDYAVTNSLKVVPSCPFIAEYITSHPEYADLVATDRTA